ncbi:anti-sigma factor [Aureisphaera galaxeae]|uniref:anti-sigma factor n=1 Tax=Aureisphaera galaxeae TaxID=1538023 RepID=UPI0023508AA3|nr:anti-sigma factor [Aureisphaera galaxeae]MDC8003568.1 anti-sigma factor [Aureisphaera galaxeae]
MTKEEIIASGLLELYVTGSLPQEDIALVEAAITSHPDLVSEIEQIEKALMELSEATGGQVSDTVWTEIQNRTEGVRTLSQTPPKRNWSSLSGWAAAILCFLGLFWMMKNNNDLKEQLRYSDAQNRSLKEQVDIQGVELAETTELLEMVRSRDFKAVTLPGNVAVSPESYVTVYYNETQDIAYIDAKGLPTPPEGKVYQVWSLKMEPLTPSSIGLLSDFEGTDSKFFKVENIPTPEAFGITLEPEGGSESPTLDQLYALGTVAP